MPRLNPPELIGAVRDQDVDFAGGKMVEAA
jgi:hypothetical protein